MNHADAMIHQIETTLAEQGAAIPVAKRSEAEAAIAAARVVMTGNDHDKLTEATERLTLAEIKIEEAALSRNQGSHHRQMLTASRPPIQMKKWWMPISRRLMAERALLERKLFFSEEKKQKTHAHHGKTIRKTHTKERQVLGYFLKRMNRFANSLRAFFEPPRASGKQVRPKGANPNTDGPWFEAGRRI